MPIKDLPEQPGERRISVHWLFLPVGLAYLAAGAIGLRIYFKGGPPVHLYWGSGCAFLGVWTLVAFAVSQKLVREGRPPKSLFTMRVRPLILIGCLGGFLFFCFAVSRLLPDRIAWAWPLIWVLGAGLIGNGIVRYFRAHPPRQ